MKVAELLERRRANWSELDQMCSLIKGTRGRNLSAEQITRFAALYRAACADLALADAYQLPPKTVQYLHRLVANAHSQLYRRRQFDLAGWVQKLLFEVPQVVFQDRCVQIAFLLFWVTFILSAILANSGTLWPEFATQMIPAEQMSKMEENFGTPLGNRDPNINFQMAGFYIRHNTSIGLQCFGGGLIVVPGVLITLFNAAHLGAVFGYMARPEVDAGKNFFEFVTAHGPFELTAIVVSAGAGLRLGISWMKTDGLTRTASLLTTARDAMPVMASAMVMFFFAALIEGFISPTSAPYFVKAGVAVISSGLLLFYFVVLGFPRRSN